MDWHQKEFKTEVSPEMEHTPNSHSQVIVSHWENYVSKLHHLDDEIALDGHSLDLATLVAVARSVLASAEVMLPLIA